MHRAHKCLVPRNIGIPILRPLWFLQIWLSKFGCKQAYLDDADSWPPGGIFDRPANPTRYTDTPGSSWMHGQILQSGRWQSRRKNRAEQQTSSDRVVARHSPKKQKRNVVHVEKCAGRLIVRVCVRACVCVCIYIYTYGHEESKKNSRDRASRPVPSRLTDWLTDSGSQHVQSPHLHQHRLASTSPAASRFQLHSSSSQNRAFSRLSLSRVPAGLAACVFVAPHSSCVPPLGFAALPRSLCFVKA